ncbi:MAG: EamA family transporter [Anaerolineales bacterium]|nr:EamA family transporter [Anaerolineales bacterium]MCB9110825.1 EamA family transporter [Anaerolineales bacterium]
MKSKIWFALITLYIVWGSTYLGIKVAIETIPPFFQGALRFLISGLIILIWQKSSGQAMPTRKQWFSTFIIGTLLLLGGNGLVSWAEQFIPSGIAALIIATVPLWLVIMEAVRPGGIKPTWQAIVGLVIGFVGIFILAGPAEISGSKTNLDTFGVVALLFATLLWALGSIYSKSADLPKASMVTTGAEMLMGSIGLMVVSLLTGELHGWDPSGISARSIGGVIYLILIGSIAGFGSYIWLLQNAPISLVATYAYVNPIVAVILGYLFANEPLEPRTWIAAAIIIGAVIFINSKGKPKVQKEAIIAE